MSYTQTVEIPPSRRLTIEVPHEVPTGPVIITFTPAVDTSDFAMAETADYCPECAKHRDPKTGELCFNAETVAAFEEGDAMLRGEKTAKWHHSLEDLDKMLGL